MAYQSLYRRYRPQKFSEIRGQEHVVRAMRNAVRDDRVGHAYLLSGPRGTGKTTAARILAKVLNCENPVDGEPDGTCESCKSIENGTSFDLHELDAASNNKVDDIRDLLSKVALGTPGRSKVYLLDEVHMLTAGAENALLKTLEEPPEHVVFVLATTEPHKVVDTIRSRTQQLQLSLIPAEQMTELVHEIAADAGLDIDDEIIGHVVKIGGGSARDTLSALDQVVAAGGIADVDSSTGELLGALATNDPGRALQAIEASTATGVDPRRIGERFVDALRTVFLVKMGSPPARLSEPERELADQFVGELSPATITRSLETIGKSLVDMRQAPDPRIDLEVAFVRITQPSTGTDSAALVARIEALEATVAAGGSGTATPASAPAKEAPVASTAPDASPATAEGQPEEAKRASSNSRPADAARAALKPRLDATSSAPAAVANSGESDDMTPSDTDVSLTASPSSTSPSAPPPPSMARPAAPPPDRAAPEPTPEQSTPEPSAPGSDQPTSSRMPPSGESGDGKSSVGLEQLRARWDDVLEAQSTKTRNRLRAGSLAAVEGDVATIAFANDAMRKRAASIVGEVETSLTSMFDAPIRIELTTSSDDPSTGSSASDGPPESTVAADNDVDLHDLTDAGTGGNSVVERITDVFPGAEVMSQPES